MKTRLLLALPLIALTACSEGQYGSNDDSTPAPDKTVEATKPDVKLASLQGEKLEVGCAKCTYEMAGVESCKTAVVVEGTPILVVGVGADAHTHGLCSGAKQAVVTGEVGPDGVKTTAMDIEGS